MYDYNENIKLLCDELELEYSPIENQNDLIKDCYHKVREIKKAIEGLNIASFGKK